MRIRDPRRRTIVCLVLLGGLLASLNASQSKAHALGVETATPDTAGDVGRYASLALDAFGNPVVAYFDTTNEDLKLIHCDDQACEGSGEAITSPATTGDVGRYASLDLDSSGRPVIAYYDATSQDLAVVRCGDPNCIAGNILTTIDEPGDVGTHVSMKLDSADRPRVSYYDATNSSLKVVRCGDALCSAGNAIVSVDSLGDVGAYSSLAIDIEGNSVVAYHDSTNDQLKVAHCRDESCTTSSIENVDAGGMFASLQLDSGGKPVIAHRNGSSASLRIDRCDDPDCTVIASGYFLDGTSNSGFYNSLTLGVIENPIVAHTNATGQLRVTHCGSTSCGASDSTSIVKAPGTAIVAGASSVTDPLGGLAIAYYDSADGDLHVVRCGHADCRARPDYSPLLPASTNYFARPSLRLASSGWPVISYGEGSVLRCEDATCTTGYSIANLYSAGSGFANSLWLSAEDLPRIATCCLGIAWPAPRDVKVIACGEQDCLSMNTVVSLWNAYEGGGGGSLVVRVAQDVNGLPHLSQRWYGQYGGGLRLLRCSSDDCSGSSNSWIDVLPGPYGVPYMPLTLHIVDTGSGPQDLITFEMGAGTKVVACGVSTCSNPVAWPWGSNFDIGQVLPGNLAALAYSSPDGLVFGYCNSLDCTTLFSTSILDPAPVIGSISIAQGAFGVIAVAYQTSEGVMLTRCGTWDCSAGNVTELVDPAGGNPTLRLDTSGRSVIGYDGYRVARCSIDSCSSDVDEDHVPDTEDNCLTFSNEGQQDSSDANFIDNSPPFAVTVDDKTSPNSDAVGDACDNDLDNDSLMNAAEAAGAACNGKITDPLLRDTDGDRALDGAECTLGFDPTSAASKPLLANCGSTGDSDGDKISDRVEYCYYNTDPDNSDTDGDRLLGGATDGCEAASFNVDRIVNVADMGMLATAISNPAYRIVNVDVNKDGAWNPADQGIVASFISPAGQCP